MRAEFTAIIEPAPEGGYWAICPEVPGANGQGETIEETKNDDLLKSRFCHPELSLSRVYRGVEWCMQALDITAWFDWLTMTIFVNFDFLHVHQE